MNTYHRRFISSFASENVIGIFSRYKGAAKEITESWAMLEAAKKFVPNLNDHVVIVVGDGCSPRTGTIMAYYTKASVISIDPNFNMAHWKEHVEKQTKMGYPPRRLRVVRDKVEHYAFNCASRPCLVLWPHSHADMDSVKLLNCNTRVDIALPCCVPIPRKWMEIPHVTYRDYNIESIQRTIHVWKQVKGKKRH